MGHPLFLSIHNFQEPQRHGLKSPRFQRDPGDRDLGSDVAFRLLAKAVFGEHGGRGWLSGANPFGSIGIAGWAFDAIPDKMGGNEFDQIFHGGLLVIAGSYFN
jgi:hypothetical protein